MFNLEEYRNFSNRIAFFRSEFFCVYCMYEKDMWTPASEGDHILRRMTKVGSSYSRRLEHPFLRMPMCINCHKRKHGTGKGKTITLSNQVQAQTWLYVDVNQMSYTHHWNQLSNTYEDWVLKAIADDWYYVIGMIRQKSVEVPARVEKILLREAEYINEKRREKMGSNNK